MADDNKERRSSWVVKILAVSQICSFGCLIYLFVIVNKLQMLTTPQEFMHQQTNAGGNRDTELQTTTIETLSISTQSRFEKRKKRQAIGGCGGQFLVNRNNADVYRIKSPNYPANYPNNARCLWKFILSFPNPSAYAGSSELNEVALSVTFPTPIFIESHDTCSFDAIEIRGGSEHGPLLGTYCGINRTISTVTFVGPIYILFRSDRFSTGKGFQAEITVVRTDFPQPRPPPPRPRPGTAFTGDATFIRWGRGTCPTGRTFYDGYAVGLSGSTGDTVKCVPLPAQFQFTDVNISVTSPQLSAAKFDLRGVDGALSQNLNNKPIKCALCHVRKTTTFMVIGWKSCNSQTGWLTAYTGYLMAVWTSDGASISSTEPICMDNSPEISNGYGTELSAPKLTYVKSGAGLWIEDKIVPCSVCVRTNT